MIQNIKVDIVYYMTATDFEFEFNLGSCCHMRLLNDKAKDKKAYVNSLARAVSRSQIILSVGPVFGEDGLIAVTAAAIGKSLKVIDNKAFGIEDDGKIEIIDGAVPLVTPEGYFGGCIIESGPQTIVILTENRTIRKSVMKTLIHPYVEDMSLMQSAGSTPAAIKTDIVREQAEPVPEEKPAQDYREEQPEMPAEDTSDSEFIEEQEPTHKTDIPEDIPKEEPETTAEAENDIEFDFSIDKEYDISETESPEDGGGLLVEEDSSYGTKKYPKGINISIIIITAILLLAIIGLLYMLVFLPMKNGVSTTEYIGQLFKGVSSTTSV